MICFTVLAINVARTSSLGGVLGLDGINSEICEQVNGYLQCVKYTASHLSQAHFVFFLQFFLYLMNKEKTESYKKLAAIALASQF